ncbi:MAG: hypothetical protein JW940_07970 [Polyangiaceae bacterium]|nr:hypothetical protein [Polyangiaceae bacterium]
MTEGGSGLGARVTCVDPKQLDACFAGRDLEAWLLDDLPASVHPCGERGEYERTGRYTRFAKADTAVPDPWQTRGQPT